jgi:hypothetical protein
MLLPLAGIAGLNHHTPNVKEEVFRAHVICLLVDTYNC